MGASLPGAVEGPWALVREKQTDVEKETEEGVFFLVLPRIRPVFAENPGHVCAPNKILSRWVTGNVSPHSQALHVGAGLSAFSLELLRLIPRQKPGAGESAEQEETLPSHAPHPPPNTPLGTTTPQTPSSPALLTHSGSASVGDMC